MREGVDLTDTVFRWRYCSTDTCGVCAARPGEVCRIVTYHDTNLIDREGEPLPYFHLQIKDKS
jgi:hypothetical protein